MKKKLTVLSILALCFVFTLSSTLAYFSTEEKAHNVITTSGVEIDLIEEMVKDDGTIVSYKDPQDVLPGQTVSKIVTVKNTGEAPVWLCLKVTTDIALKDAPTGSVADLAVVEIDFNTDDWTEKDGYWYYTKMEEGSDSPKPLAHNEVTTPLFREVTLKGPEMDNLYANSTITVDVQAFAVQSQNNGSSALEAKGWPVEQN